VIHYGQACEGNPVSDGQIPDNFFAAQQSDLGYPVGRAHRCSLQRAQVFTLGQYNMPGSGGSAGSYAFQYLHEIQDPSIRANCT
jgi:hypothetical protein